MSLFTVSEEEQEEARGLSDHELSFLKDNQLILLALAELLEVSVEDDGLIKELYKRAGSKNGK